MSREYLPYQQTKVRDVVDTGNALDISEKTLSFRIPVEDTLIIPDHNILTKYYDVIKQFIVTYEMTNEEYQLYKYQPKKFCYDKYGTPELAYSLLYINNMISVIEFTKQKIKVFSSDILDVVNELFDILEDDLKTNRTLVENE